MKKLLEELKRQLAVLLKIKSDRERLQPLVARKANEVVETMRLLGLPVRIVEGYRSIARQNDLYAQGRTKPGAIVTNAKGGQSFHNYGVAVDFVFVNTGYNAPDAHWYVLGSMAKKNGFSWGGDWSGFKDRPHCELTLGYTLAEFQKGTVDYSRFN